VQRHIRYNPETRRCAEEPFPEKTNEDIPVFDENACLDQAIAEVCQDYFGLPCAEEATPPMNEKKIPASPRRRLSLSFKNSASLDVIEYELEDFAPSPQACEEVEEVPAYEFGQCAPFYAMKEVCEEDRNYLLKMISLAPNQPYVPSFLRDACHTTVETYEFSASCSEDEEVVEHQAQETYPDPAPCEEPESYQEHEDQEGDPLQECQADAPLTVEEEQELEVVLCEADDCQGELPQAEECLLEEDQCLL